MASATAPTMSGAVPVNNGPAHWTAPATWQELAPTSVRLGNFVVSGPGGKRAEVAVTSFPGSVGTELDNINRWRRELGLDPAQAGDTKSEPVTVGGSEGKLYDFSGAQEQTLVASISHDGATWFFKMRGDKEVVAGARASFSTFLKSVQFGPGGADAHAGMAMGAAAPAVPADPHAGMATPGKLDGPVAGEPKWSPPANWKEQGAGMMVLKKFSVTNDKGQSAMISISTFAGDVGGPFANVNRWRSQMTLPQITEAEMPKYTKTLDVGKGAKGMMVDFSGVDAQTSKAGRLIAISVPHAGGTWFYKLLGDDAVVAAEKDGFVKFVTAVIYP